METLKRAVPVLSHLILVAVLVLVWEKAPDAVHALVTETLGANPSKTVMYILEYVATFVLLVAIVFLFERLSSLRIWTSLVRDKSLQPFEGHWVQHISLDERPVSIGFIRFDSASERWDYNGVGFAKGSEFTPAATWHTSSLRYDQHERSWYFAGTSRTLDTKDARYTVVPILHLPQGPPDNLTGTVADIGAGGLRRIFDIRDMRRIPTGTVSDHRLATTDAIRSLSSDEVRAILKAVKLPDG